MNFLVKLKLAVITFFVKRSSKIFRAHLRHEILDHLYIEFIKRMDTAVFRKDLQHIFPSEINAVNALNDSQLSKVSIDAVNNLRMELYKQIWTELPKYAMRNDTSYSTDDAMVLYIDSPNLSMSTKRFIRSVVVFSDSNLSLLPANEEELNYLTKQAIIESNRNKFNLSYYPTEISDSISDSTAFIDEFIDTHRAISSEANTITVNNFIPLDIAEHELMRAALDEICNPILYMQHRLQEGEELNDHTAVQLANDPEYLRNIAKRCYEKLSFIPNICKEITPFTKD